MFGKIVVVIFLFTTVVWFISSKSQEIQYQNTDTIYDYQNLILHELLVREWAYNLDNPSKLEKLVQADLQALKQMAYIAIFSDRDTNKSIDFNVDIVSLRSVSS